MKYVRLFDSVEEMETVIASSEIGILGLAYDGSTPVMENKPTPPPPPSNLVISCSNNTVTISATNATTLEYNTDGSSTYTTYTEPFDITETVTVYAKATNGGGSITASQVCEYIKPIDYTIPFYIEDISGSANTIQIKKSTDNAPTLTIYKSTDGKTWETMGSTSTTAITATVPANGKLYLRCSATTWGANGYYNNINTTGNCNVGGNIMSLLYGSNFTGNETTFPSDSTYNVNNLFKANTQLVNASNLLLPATTLAESCYHGMFQGCTSLTTAPVLPATTLAYSCYHGMFQGCTSLTTAPELPVTTMTFGCYQFMFQNCTSLTTAPALPATTLADYCYNNMFNGCTSLTAAPELPATTLANYCYKSMFGSCTSLTTAPELPATTLTQKCYQYMFQGCTSLNYIKCLATDISASNCTNKWVENVALTGTFVKAASMSSWTTGINGIPSGWTV